MHKCNVHYEAMPDDITDFEIYGSQKNAKIYLSQEQRKQFFHTSKATLLQN